MIQPAKFIQKILLVLTASSVIGSCQVSRSIYYNFADINDYRIFPNREVMKDSSCFSFYTTDKGCFPKTINSREKQVPFDEYLQSNKTVAFLIIHNDTIQYEKYFGSYEEGSIVPSFSMAKSITSILVGCAIQDSLINSVEDPVTRYVPELASNGMQKVKIRHLLQMTSGIDFRESYVNPFGDAAAYYYGSDLRKKLLEMKLKTEPGKEFEYLSGNTQLLGLVLERALKTKTITQYLQEKIWKPLGMEYDASWSLDHEGDGLEKTYCCINARARDYAKIGRLYANKGNWNGKQIVPESLVLESTKIDTTEGSIPFYQYQWWITSREGDFMAQGILGQYIYVNPAKNLVIVRLGKKEGNANWRRIFRSIASVY